MNEREIVANAPETSIVYCKYEYGDLEHGLYLNGKNEFYDNDEKRWFPMDLVNNYFHSFRRLSDIERIIALEDELERVKSNLYEFTKELLRN